MEQSSYAAIFEILSILESTTLPVKNKHAIHWVVLSASFPSTKSSSDLTKHIPSAHFAILNSPSFG